MSIKLLPRFLRPCCNSIITLDFIRYWVLSNVTYIVIKSVGLAFLMRHSRRFWCLISGRPVRKLSCLYSSSHITFGKRLYCLVVKCCSSLLLSNRHFRRFTANFIFLFIRACAMRRDHAILITGRSRLWSCWPRLNYQCILCALSYLAVVDRMLCNETPHIKQTPVRVRMSINSRNKIDWQVWELTNEHTCASNLICAFSLIFQTANCFLYAPLYKPTVNTTLDTIYQ